MTVVRDTGRVIVGVGTNGTWTTEFAISEPSPFGVLQLLGGDFSTEGMPVVASQNRGPIDIAAWNRHHWLETRWRQPTAKTVELTATVRGFEGYSGNGTPDQEASALERFASVALAGAPSKDFSWNAVLYLQDQDASNVFSFINASRTAEIPVSDEFAMPDSAVGASWTGSWWGASGGRTIAGHR
jgi:hypothetical protein